MEDKLKGELFPEIPLSHSALVFSEYPSTSQIKASNKQIDQIKGKKEKYTTEVKPLNQTNSVNQIKNSEDIDYLAESAMDLFSAENTSMNERKPIIGNVSLKTENKITGQNGSNAANYLENNFDFLDNSPIPDFEEYKVEQNTSDLRKNLPRSKTEQATYDFASELITTENNINSGTAVKNDYFSNYDELNLGFDIDNNNLETNYLGTDTTKAKVIDNNNDSEKILSELGIFDYQENQNQNLKKSHEKGLEITEYPSTKVSVKNDTKQTINLSYENDNQELNINELLNNNTNNNSSYSYEYSYEDFSSTNNNNLDINKNTYTDDNSDIDKYINTMDIDTYIHTDNASNNNINKEILKQTQTNRTETKLKKESSKPIQSFNIPMTSTLKKTNVIQKESSYMDNELNIEEYQTTEKNSLKGYPLEHNELFLNESSSVKTKETSTQTDDNYLIIPYNQDEKRDNVKTTKSKIEIKETTQKKNNEFEFQTTEINSANIPEYQNIYIPETVETTTKTSIPITQNQNQISTTIPTETQIVTQTKQKIDNIFPLETQIISQAAPKIENLIPTETRVESQTAQKIENIFPTETRTSFEFDNKALSKTQYIPTTIDTAIPETNIIETNSIKTDNNFSYTTTPITVNYPKIETQIPQFTTTSPVIPITTTTTIAQDQINTQTIIPPTIPTINNPITISETPIQTIPTINSPITVNKTFIPTTNIIPLENQSKVSLTSPTFQSVLPTQFSSLETEKQSSYITLPNLSPSLTQITLPETTITHTTVVPPITNTTTTNTNIIPYESQTQDLFSSKNLSQSYTIINNDLSALPQSQIPISNISYENQNIYGLNNNIGFQQNQFGNNNINYYQLKDFSSFPVIQNPNPVPILMTNPTELGTQKEMIPVEEIEYVPVKKIKYVQKEKPLTSNIPMQMYNTNSYFQQNPPINYIQNYNQPIVNPVNPNPNILSYKNSSFPYSTNTEIDNEVEDPAIPLEDREKNNLNYNTSSIPKLGTNNLNYNTYSLPQPRSSFGVFNVNFNNMGGPLRSSFMDNNWINSNYQLKTYKPRGLSKFK